MRASRLMTVMYVAVGGLAAGCSGGSPSDFGEADTAQSAPAAPGASASPVPLLDRKEWRKAMSRTPASKEGCFKVTHPSTTWEEVPCTTAPDIQYGARPGARGGGAIQGASGTAGGRFDVGYGLGFSSDVSGTMSWAEGSFPSVTGSATSNNFSLQLNSNIFYGPSSGCSGAATPAYCNGWVQFVYAPSSAFIQYWMFDYVNNCPTNWRSDNLGDCYRNSAAVSVPTISSANLADVTLTGAAGSSDTITVTTDDSTLYRTSQANLIDLNQHWTDAEFNIFGNGSQSPLITFNPGSTLAVQLLTGSVVPTTAPPSCGNDVNSGEANSLDILTDSCCPIGGASPGIQFMESNVPGQTAPACRKEATQQPSLLWWNGTSGQISGWVVNPDGSVPRTENLSWQCTQASGCASAWSPMSTMANNIFWWDRTSGQVSTWVLDPEGNVTSPGSLSWTCGGTCASTWLFLGGVMEGTQPGILWYDKASGQLSLWNVSGTTVTGAQTLSWTCGGSCASSWVEIETGDINNDGYSDIIWQNPTTGVVSAWLLNGATVIGTQQLSWTCSTATGCWGAWWIIGVLDVNGDGIADVSWWNQPTGQISSWLLDGSGNVTGTQTLSKTCGGSCGSSQFPVGYVSFP
jgi:hypothetical protein